MQWLNPAGAWAFLGLLPVLALYFLRRRAKREPVPSLLLWRKTQERCEANKPFQKLRNQLLLWLQLLLIALLAVALMRPAGIYGGQGETLLVFDLSASMQTATANKATRLDEAKREAYRILEGLRDDDAVTVLAAGRTFSQLVTRSKDASAVRRAIDGLKPQNGASDMEGALSLALAMRRDLPSLGITILSDRYQTKNTSVQVVSVGQSMPNRSILSLRLSEQDGGAIAFAQLENRGEQCDAELECYADGVLCDLRTITLEKDAKQSVRFALPSEARRVMVKFSDADALPADDARYAAKQAGTNRKVLLVSENNIFLERALALRSDVTVVKATRSDAQGAQGYDLYLYDCVLPETLPNTGAVFAIAPTAEVCGISPSAKKSDVGSLRAGTGEEAKRLSQNLLLSDISLRSYTPLVGGVPALTTNGQTLLALSEQGARRAAALGFDLHDSNLPLQADFPVLIQNLLSYLLPDVSASVSGTSCGETITPSLDERTLAARVRSPFDRMLPLTGGVLMDTDEIGLYTLIEERADGAARETAFALHIPPAESDTQTIAASSGEKNQGAANATGTGGEWTPWVLLLCFAVLLLEWEVSRRGA